MTPRHALAALTLSLACLSGGASALAAQQAPRPSVPRALGLVLASSLNVREAPALDADVRASVPRGDTLCVIAVEGDWARVRVRGRADASVLEGFASRGFLSEVRVAASVLESAGCGPRSR